VMRRPAFALATALVAIVLIGVLVTGALFASNQESHAAAAELADEKVFTYAERAAVIAGMAWSCPECDLMPVGSVIIRSPSASPPLESTVYITRLDSALFLVTGEGRLMESGMPRVKRRVSIVVTTSRDSLGVTTTRLTRGEFWSAVYQM
jgi:hypothetical protein